MKASWPRSTCVILGWHIVQLAHAGTSVVMHMTCNEMNLKSLSDAQVSVRAEARTVGSACAAESGS